MSDQARSADLGISLRTLARVASSILAVGLLATAQARADAVADFYRGKQLNLIVGYGTGGGYDVYVPARQTDARYLD